MPIGKQARRSASDCNRHNSRLSLVRAERGRVRECLVVVKQHPDAEGVEIVGELVE